MKTLPLLLAAMSASVLLSGCWWDSDYDGNYDVHVVNETNRTITVSYDTSVEDCDCYQVDSVDTRIDAGSEKWIFVNDTGFDAEIFVEYDGVVHRYDIDPDYWGEDRVTVRVEDFQHNN